MKLFTPRKTSGQPGEEHRPATLEEISARLDKLERVVTDLKQNIDLIPAIVRKLYLDDVVLPLCALAVMDVGVACRVTRTIRV